MAAAFTVECDIDTALTPQVPVVAAPEDFQLVDEELVTYPDPDYDEFGRPIA